MVNVLAQPTGRLLLARDPYKIDMHRVIEAAVEHDTAMEINAHPQRLDLDWRWCKYAKGRGAKVAIGPDAHVASDIACMRYGVGVARKGWIEKDDLINCLDVNALVRDLKKRGL